VCGRFGGGTIEAGDDVTRVALVQSDSDEHGGCPQSRLKPSLNPVWQ
jgi:hypothetical protein